MTERTDWENVNIGCMFVCMNNAIDSIMRMIEEDGELSEKFFDDDGLDTLAEALSLIDSKRMKVRKMLSKMFKEDREIARSRQSEDTKEEKKEDEYKILDDDSGPKVSNIFVCIHKRGEDE